MLYYINPECCIDCEACVAKCPVDAIFHKDDVPVEHRADINLNREMSRVFPGITERP